MIFGGPRWTRTAYLRARLGFVEASGPGILNPSVSRPWAVRVLTYRLTSTSPRLTGDAILQRLACALAPGWATSDELHRRLALPFPGSNASRRRVVHVVA